MKGLGRLVGGALVCAVLLAAAGCGGDDTSSAFDTTTSMTSTTASTPTPPTSGSTFEANFSADFTAEDAGGDSGTFTVSFGEAEAASEVDDPAVQACSSRVSQLDRAVAIPVQVRGTLSSSMSSDLSVDLSGMSEINDGDLLSGFYLWAATYGDAGSVCANSGDYDSGAGFVQWSDAEAGSVKRFTTWLVIEDAITPDDPAGSERVGKMALTGPSVRFGENNATVAWQSGDALVACYAGDPAAGRSQVAAVDPLSAHSDGCV